MKVNYYFRNKLPTNHSIENIFDAMIDELAGEVTANSFYTKKPVDLTSVINVSKLEADIHHITGAVNYLALGLPRRNTILTVHDIGRYENNSTKSFKSWLYRKFWFEFPLSKVKLITVVSEFTKNKLVDVFSVDPSKIRVINNPLMPHIKKLPYILKNEKFSILQIGSGAHKNLRGLIHSIVDLPIHLIIIGKLSFDNKSLLEKYNISHEVHFNISNEEVNQLYNKTDVLFFASYYEGFGMPIIEAQAVGKPVITSNFGAMKEVSNGTALLVDPNNIVQIKRCVTSLMNDKALYNKYIKVGFDNARRFDRENVALQYLSIYKEIYRACIRK